MYRKTNPLFGLAASPFARAHDARVRVRRAIARRAAHGVDGARVLLRVAARDDGGGGGAVRRRAPRARSSGGGATGADGAASRDARDGGRGRAEVPIDHVLSIRRDRGPGGGGGAASRAHRATGLGTARTDIRQRARH